MTAATISLPCDACGTSISGDGPDGFGDAYVTHVRVEHPGWGYSDRAIRRYAAQHVERAQGHDGPAD